MQEQKNSEYYEAPKQTKSTGLALGAFLAVVGVGHLIRTLFPSLLPNFLFTWQFSLILMGVLLGIIGKFKGNTWWIMVVLGTFFFFSGQIYSFLRQYDINLKKFIFPVILIIVGVLIFLRSKRRSEANYKYHPPHRPTYHTNTPENTFQQNTATSSQSEEGVKSEETQQSHNFGHQHNRSHFESTVDYTDFSAIFGSNERVVVSKKYLGGNVTSLFGGAVLDLHSADFDNVVVIDIFCLFGGVDIIVPSNWSIKNETTTFLASVDDNRRNKNLIEPQKILILKGFVMMGGLEIRN